MINKTLNSSKRRERRYRLTQERYDIIINEQNNLCAICKLKVPTDVDHNRKTGHFRGLLCRACNLGLGMFADNVERMAAAIEYLNRPSKSISEKLPIAKRWTGPKHQKGELCHSSKLTENDVRNMRIEYAKGGISYPKLAEKYGIHPVHLARVIRREIWEHVL